MADQQNLPHLKLVFESKATKELSTILAKSQDDFFPSAIETIKEILLERGLSTLQVDELSKQFAPAKLQQGSKIQTLATKASFGKRTLQIIIDGFVVYGTLLVLSIALQYYDRELFPGKWMQNVIRTGIVLLYFLITETIWSKTVGMMSCNLIVVDYKSENRIGFSRAALRTLGRLLCMLTGGLGYLIFIKGRCLHDRLSQTMVIYERK